MATFLQLCQRVASDSNTISHGKPTTVAAQTDRLAKVVRMTNDAWRMIQNAHNDWRWMQGEFYGDLVDGTQRYAYTAFNDLVTTAAITRFADWIYWPGKPDSGISLYDTAVGVGEEGPLRFREWEQFFAINTRGTQTEDKPQLFSVTPDGKLAFAPTPDANTYRVRGRYRKDVQEMTVDGDIPEMPVRFHHLIADLALDLLGTHDEALNQIPLWRLRKMQGFAELERDQLPRMKWPRPLA